MTEIEQLEKDAARYRWLRNKSIDQWEHPLVVSQGYMFGKQTYYGPVIGEILDEQIDVAIAAGSE